MKYTINNNQPFASLNGLTVLLVEPESEARAFYSQQLANISVRVVAVEDIRSLHTDAVAAEPDIVIVNPSADVQVGVRVLKAFRDAYPNVPIITMTLTMPDETIDAIMSTGVSLHINRGLTRPRDVLIAMEQVLFLK